MPKSPMLIHGMFGLGDNIHQRAALRILKETHNITLGTMWASLYHDLVGPDFRIVRRNAALRTQLKNAEREKHLFSPDQQLPSQHGVRFSYTASQIEHRTNSKTVLEAMFSSVGIQKRYPEADFRLPVKQEWLDSIDAIIATWRTRGKPIMVYRPLTARPEWGGGALRNADHDAYAEMASMLRDRYFIVSVADLEPGKEWIVGPPFPADVCYHEGELYFELLAALFRRADLVFTSGGYGAMLGPAVETPTISIYGGYEPAAWCADGAKWSPYLAIQPIKPCYCGTSACRNRCGKQTDIPAARAAVNLFVDKLGPVVNSKGYAHWREMTGGPGTKDTPENRDLFARMSLPHIEVPMERLELPDVTLVCVETQTHNLATLAINDAVSKVKFGDVLIYTDKPEAIPVLGARYTIVPNWPDKIKMGAFYYKEAAAPITTSHAILMEWDAGIRDTEMWDPEFLNFDYIGAPWPGAPHGGYNPTGGFNVGNGGFCLISRRLATFIFENRHRFDISTDIGISRTYRGEFEGFAKWAPESVAWRFSFECGPPEQAVKPSFGYHDVFNWHLALPNAETIKRTRLLMANDYIVTHTPKLGLLARSAPWLRTEIGPAFAEAERRYGRPLPTAKHLQGRDSINRLIRTLPGVAVTRAPNQAREAYIRELQRRGLKA